jgi:hypothetical protein
MLEEFITIALEAFTNANGDMDKFELYLRRKLMSYNTSAVLPQIQKESVVVPPIDMSLSSLDVNDPIFNELEGLDLSAMNDNEIIALASKLGFVNNQPQE